VPGPVGSRPEAGLAYRRRLERWIASDEFTCLGAKASVRRGLLRHVTLGAMATRSATMALHDSLVRFATGTLSADENFATHVAVFDGPGRTAEDEFDQLLWRQLTDLHQLDAERGYAWAAGVGSDPGAPDFCFSVAGHAFFVVGMHPGAQRIARRFPSPAIAFNSHDQFERLRQAGTYAGLQSRIRRREVRLQGSLNPNLAEFGDQSDARQYSSQPKDAAWRCPFRRLDGGADLSEARR
jgi:FPC/CPF motif-containing protein YcgG